MADGNGRVSLREYLEMRFDALEKKVDLMIGTHEKRISRLEKQSNWRWLAEGIIALAAAVGIGTGVKS